MPDALFGLVGSTGSTTTVSPPIKTINSDYNASFTGEFGLTLIANIPLDNKIAVGLFYNYEGQSTSYKATESTMEFNQQVNKAGETLGLYF